MIFQHWGQAETAICRSCKVLERRVTLLADILSDVADGALLPQFPGPFESFFTRQVHAA